MGPTPSVTRTYAAMKRNDLLELQEVFNLQIQNYNNNNRFGNNAEITILLRYAILLDDIELFKWFHLNVYLKLNNLGSEHSLTKTSLPPLIFYTHDDLELFKSAVTHMAINIVRYIYDDYLQFQTQCASLSTNLNQPDPSQSTILSPPHHNDQSDIVDIDNRLLYPMQYYHSGGVPSSSSSIWVDITDIYNPFEPIKSTCLGKAPSNVRFNPVYLDYENRIEQLATNHNVVLESPLVTNSTTEATMTTTTTTPPQLNLSILYHSRKDEKYIGRIECRKKQLNTMIDFLMTIPTYAESIDQFDLENDAAPMALALTTLNIPLAQRLWDYGAGIDEKQLYHLLLFFPHVINAENHTLVCDTVFWLYSNIPAFRKLISSRWPNGSTALLSALKAEDGIPLALLYLYLGVDFTEKDYPNKKFEYKFSPEQIVKSNCNNNNNINPDNTDLTKILSIDYQIDAVNHCTDSMTSRVVSSIPTSIHPPNTIIDMNELTTLLLNYIDSGSVEITHPQPDMKGSNSLMIASAIDADWFVDVLLEKIVDSLLVPTLSQSNPDSTP